MRMIKSPLEIEVMRQAGQDCRCDDGRQLKALWPEGVPEYEAALAVINAGTREGGGFPDIQGMGAPLFRR